MPSYFIGNAKYKQMSDSETLSVSQNTHSCYVQYNTTSRSYRSRKNMQSLKFHSSFYHDTFINLLLHHLNNCWCFCSFSYYDCYVAVSVALWRPTGYTAPQTQLNQSSSNKLCVVFSFSSKTKQWYFWGFFLQVYNSLYVLSCHEPHKKPIVLCTSNMEDKYQFAMYQIGRDTWKCDFLSIYLFSVWFGSYQPKSKRPCMCTC